MHRSLVVERDTHRPVLVNPRKLMTGKQEINNYTRLHHQLRPLTQIGGETTAKSRYGASAHIAQGRVQTTNDKLADGVELPRL